jgi:hypothetical protein
MFLKPARRTQNDLAREIYHPGSGTDWLLT